MLDCVTEVVFQAVAYRLHLVDLDGRRLCRWSSWWGVLALWRNYRILLERYRLEPAWQDCDDDLLFDSGPVFGLAGIRGR